MEQQIHTHVFDNGLTLLAERLPHVRSAAFNILVRGGGAYETEDRLGLSGILCDLITRGCGELDSRGFSDALGLDRSESNGAIHLRFAGVVLADHLTPALKLYGDLLRRPLFPEEELEAVQSLSLQELQNLEDDPSAKLMVTLRQAYYPKPLDRDQRGTKETIEAITIEDVRQHHARHFGPQNTVLAVAGHIDWEQLKRDVATIFADWQPGMPTHYPLVENKPIVPQYVHVEKELDQTQIAWLYPSVTYDDERTYLARAAMAVLSLDMAARLFTEVREKHGLCYSVYASYEAYKDRGSFLGAAGAKPEKAQETLERSLREFYRLTEGIADEELERIRIGLKSSLIMRQESTNARVASLCSDWYYLGRIRTLQEIQAAIDGLKIPDVIAFLHDYPPRNITLATFGPKPLEWKPV
jgi:predicted Zn-dependent peptidase